MNIKKESELKSLQYLEEYLNFEKINKIYERDLKLATQIEEKVLSGIQRDSFTSFNHLLAMKGKNSPKGPKADEVVKCYESVIANIIELIQLKDFDEDAKRRYIADHLSYKAVR